jgi:hypothetical protein
VKSQELAQSETGESDTGGPREVTSREIGGLNSASGVSLRRYAIKAPTHILNRVVAVARVNMHI